MLTRRTNSIISVFVLLIVAMMVVPLPPVLLDVLIAVNFSMAIAILLLTMYTKEPLDFSVFPSLLLIMTLFRLSINVSSTRLILLRHNAGSIIEAFGQFVVGGNEVVGLIIFIILVIIQFVVITKGAERVAEVAARFTLDAMPGKQMSIDADLSSGLITEEDARLRRRAIEQEADFYGAMDGASKFVKGDAIAGLIITAINLLGGFAVGMLQHGLPAAEAWHKYALLTVGDGLVSQLPALIISTATGIIVTRSASRENLGADVIGQVLSTPKVLSITGGALLALALVPGFPKPSLVILGIVWLLLGRMVEKSKLVTESKEREEAYRKELEEQKSPEAALNLIKVDPLEIEFGLALLPIADPSQGGDLIDRIVMIRRQLASELGVLIPVIRVRDNFAGLGPNSYRINLRGIEIGYGEVYPDRVMALGGTPTAQELQGIPGKEPAFGLDVVWIPKSQKEEAEALGYTVIEASAVIATHLTEVLRKNAHLLLTRQETQRLIDLVKAEDAPCVEEAIPNLVSLGDCQKVLQNLLKEGIPIRDLVTIMEGIADAAKVSKDPDYLTMRVRENLSKLITVTVGLDRGPFQVAVLGPDLEKEILEATRRGDRGAYVAIASERLAKIMQAIQVAMSEIAPKAPKPVLLTSASCRSQVYEIASRVVPEVAVVAYEELDDRANIEVAKVITIEQQ
ncbi:MAG TPA: flagellar biosynthesis protein FlhA [Bacillota bacterium]|nr:flagellar biosynthesis protein FlhA [Bacillota bacterium]HOV66031.1 flagellar biosynthesis protein FlhA [Bacillota bacterium]HRC53201.1 flagellar biosynthesis protein FlhA [Bacillota bacterium]